MKNKSFSVGHHVSCFHSIARETKEIRDKCKDSLVNISDHNISDNLPYLIAGYVIQKIETLQYSQKHFNCEKSKKALKFLKTKFNKL